MDCPACLVTVKKALGKVDGVSRAVLDFGKRQAIVSFDEAKTSAAEAMTGATVDTGYPSTVVGSMK